MPSENTWDTMSGDRRNRYEGRIRTWNNTPNFGTIPEDQRPVNGYSDKRLRMENSPFTEQFDSWDYVNGRWSNNYITTYQRTMSEVYSFYNWNRSSVDSEWAQALVGIEDRVQLATILKVADAKVNIGVALAEARKTSDLIIDTMHRVNRAYRYLRKGNLKGVARELNITPNRAHKTWLEYKYGWLPLLMDVKGAAEFFAQSYLTRPLRFKVKASENVTKTFDKGTLFTPWGGPPMITSTDFWSRHYKYSGMIWCELTSPHFAELQQLGVTNPALEKWELLPYSFVLDWFISVGGWLEALTAFNGVRVISACTSSVLDEGWIWSSPPTDRQDVSYRYKGLTGQNYGLTSRHYVRNHWVPSPPTFPPVTNYKREFGFAKIATAASLLKGGYRGNARI